MRNMVKQPTKQQAWTKNAKEKIFSREVFPKKINQINNRLKRRTNWIFLLKYGQNCANGKVWRKLNLNLRLIAFEELRRPHQNCWAKLNFKIIDAQMVVNASTLHFLLKNVLAHAISTSKLMCYAPIVQMVLRNVLS